MVEKRANHRRLLTPTSQVPFCTMRGEFLVTERRRLPSRRVNDIDVKEISLDDYMSELH